MCCKVYEFNDKYGNSVFLNADDSNKIKSEQVLELYVNWYNKVFAPFENRPIINIEDFTYVRNFCPIDFYEESLLLREEFSALEERDINPILDDLE